MGSRFSSPPALGETFGTIVHVDCVSRVETKKLKEKGIILPTETRDAILEEIPQAYKGWWMKSQKWSVRLGSPVKVARVRSNGSCQG